MTEHVGQTRQFATRVLPGCQKRINALYGGTAMVFRAGQGLSHDLQRNVCCLSEARTRLGI